jgi:DNA polymerase III epsilon subunit-like protein
VADILFLDVETSGYDFDNILDRSGGYRYQIVSIGLIVVSPTTWKVREELYVEIKYNGESFWDKKAEAVHGLTKDYLEENGLDEEEAFLVIAEFLTRHFDVNKPIILGGHNVSTFDRHFLVALFAKYDVKLSLSGRAIDTYSLGRVLFGTNDSTELFEMVGGERVTHNALEDAQLALKVVRMCNKLFNDAVK